MIQSAIIKLNQQIEIVDLDTGKPERAIITAFEERNKKITALGIRRLRKNPDFVNADELKMQSATRKQE
jgi:hypothetical protein